MGKRLPVSETFYAVDPGADQGVSCWVSGKLFYACLGFPRVTIACASLVIERPQIYSPKVSKADPDDIITLAMRAGKAVQYFLDRGLNESNVLEVKPATWKGQVKKEVHHARILKALLHEEVLLLTAFLEPVAKAKRHNVLDAVGLGLWALGRIR
jgi:hypothetical protein